MVVTFKPELLHIITNLTCILNTHCLYLKIVYFSPIWRLFFLNQDNNTFSILQNDVLLTCLKTFFFLNLDNSTFFMLENNVLLTYLKAFFYYQDDPNPCLLIQLQLLLYCLCCIVNKKKKKEMSCILLWHSLLSRSSAQNKM